MILSGTAVNLRHVPVFFRSSKVFYAEIVAYTFAHVVHAPVEPIDEEVDVLRRADWVAELCLRFTCPDVACILCFVALRILPMLPRIPEESAEHERVEALRSTAAKDLVLEFLWSVVALEVQAESVLRVLLGQSAVSSVQLQAAINREIMVSRTAKEFEADRPLPPSPTAITYGTTGEDVDASCLLVLFSIEEVVSVRNERDDRQRGDAFGNVGCIRLVAHDFRVHLVVGNGSSRDLAVLAPVVGIACGTIGLRQEALRKDVRGCCDVAPNGIRDEICRANDCGSADCERTVVELSFHARVAAIVGIIEGRTRHRRSDGEAEGLIIDAVRHAERWRPSPKHPQRQQACQHTKH